MVETRIDSPAPTTSFPVRALLLGELPGFVGLVFFGLGFLISVCIWGAGANR